MNKIQISPYIYPCMPLHHIRLLYETDVTPEVISTKIEEYFYLDKGSILKTRRFKELVLARHFFMYFLEEKKHFSPTAISDILKRDRTTIIKNMHNFKGWLETDDTIKKMLFELNEILSPVTKL